MLAIFLWIAAILLILFAFLQWLAPDNAYFEKRNIKFLDSKFSRRFAFALFTGKYTGTEWAQALYRALPDEKIYGSWDFGRPQYTVRDPEAIKQFGVKGFDHFEDHRPFTDEKADKLWGNSLIFMNGEKWRQMRATLSPAFTGSKMRQMFELVADCANDVVHYFEEQSKNGQRLNIEMKDFFSRYTNDVIASCAFGLKINSIADPENDFYVNGKKMIDFTGLKFLFKSILLNKLPSVARALNISILDHSIANSFKHSILDTMKIRKDQNIYRPDMINMLMEIQDGTLKHQFEEMQKDKDAFAAVEESEVGRKAVNREWNDDEIVAQCFLFFAAGFDAPSNLLTFVAYELIANPIIQQKLYDEIVETEQNLNGKRITYETLQKMKYMDQVICEALRKWPGAVTVDRICVKDYVYDDGDKLRFRVEKGSILVFPIYGIQNDPKYFPDPGRFDPERFNDANKGHIKSGTYIPFGVGPRNCIGSRFALMVIKAILYNLLLKFSFEPIERTQIPIKLKKSGFTPIPENGIHLEIKPRKQ